MYIFAIACLSVLTLMFSDFAQKVMRKELSRLWDRRGSTGRMIAAGAAFFALALLSSGLSLAARLFPPFEPPIFPNATA